MQKAGLGARLKKMGIEIQPKTTADKIFDGICVFALILMSVIIVFPIWNVVVNSFSSAAAAGKGIFWPAEFSVENYRAVFRDTFIWMAFLISVLKTVIGVAPTRLPSWFRSTSGARTS